MSHPGQFVWHDLITPDHAGTTAFYEALLGWKVEEVNPTTGVARVVAGAIPVATIVLRDEAEARWLPYCLVDDLERACARASALGGGVEPAPRALATGDAAVVVDPAGAPIAATAAHPEGLPRAAAGAAQAGQFYWVELMTDDAERALAFHREVFGWRVESSESTGSLYHMLHAGAEPCGGLMQLPPGGDTEPSWLSYVLVDDLDATHASASVLGGRELQGPRDILGVGRFSVVADPAGAVLALFTR